jgi:hypothetical protein
MVQRRMLRIIRSKEIGHTAVVTDPSKIHGDNLNTIRCEASRHFRNKKKEYLKDRINEFITKCKNKNVRDLYRGRNEFKMGYQTRNNLV